MTPAASDTRLTRATISVMSDANLPDTCNHGGHVLDDVQRGQTMIVTCSGKPVAEPRPLGRQGTPAADLLRRWKRVPSIDLVARTDIERRTRQAVLQQVEADFNPVPFDDAAARAYDALIAATAKARGLPLYTRNPDDFEGIDGVTVVDRNPR
jgi:antitoxin (DNA-binding transcriptional repressor) of toxin-antitoxin stability system